MQVSSVKTSVHGCGGRLSAWIKDIVNADQDLIKIKEDAKENNFCERDDAEYKC
jgi:hypothetical protein